LITFFFIKTKPKMITPNIERARIYIYIYIDTHTYKVKLTMKQNVIMYRMDSQY
jgi:hypothetical protein